MPVRLLLWLLRSCSVTGGVIVLPRYCLELIDLIKRTVGFTTAIHTGSRQVNNNSHSKKVLFPAGLFTDGYCYSNLFSLLLSGVLQPLTCT